jgi:hypothetical protein
MVNVSRLDINELLGESAQQQVVHSNVGLFLQSLADLLILKVTCGEVNGAIIIAG